MRLGSVEKGAIRTAIFKRDPKAKVFLYGSRANPTLTGGDIDLLVISEILNLTDKLDILSEIKEEIGDQRIDILLKTKEHASTDPFVREILSGAKELL